MPRKIAVDKAAEPNFCVYKVTCWKNYFDTDPDVVIVERGHSYYSARRRCIELNAQDPDVPRRAKHLTLYKTASTAVVEEAIEKYNQPRLF